jgi:hypothetical protein
MQPLGILATSLRWPSREWAVSAFDWPLGFAEYENPAGCRVFVGPFIFDTQLSAPAVACIAAASLVVLVGLTALAITKLRAQ